MTERIYVPHHVRADGDCGGDEKIIGLYGSENAAKAAILRLEDQPGFRDQPDGFQISSYVLNQDHWTEGFVIVNSVTR